MYVFKSYFVSPTSLFPRIQYRVLEQSALLQIKNFQVLHLVLEEQFFPDGGGFRSRTDRVPWSFLLAGGGQAWFSTPRKSCRRLLIHDGMPFKLILGIIFSLHKSFARVCKKRLLFILASLTFSLRIMKLFKPAMFGRGNYNGLSVSSSCNRVCSDICIYQQHQHPPWLSCKTI